MSDYQTSVLHLFHTGKTWPKWASSDIFRPTCLANDNNIYSLIFWVDRLFESTSEPAWDSDPHSIQTAQRQFNFIVAFLFCLWALRRQADGQPVLAPSVIVCSPSFCGVSSTVGTCWQLFGWLSMSNMQSPPVREIRLSSAECIRAQEEKQGKKESSWSLSL